MDLPPEAWTLGSALLGAAVGGLASLGGSYYVYRARHRREMRIRIFDEYVREAMSAVARWYRRSEEGSHDMDQDDALTALAQVRRAAVIASRADQKQVAEWYEAEKALQNLRDEFWKLWHGGVKTRTARRDELCAQVMVSATVVIAGLAQYWDWLGKKIG